MFTDYRLTSKFLKSCDNDIAALKCGRFDSSENATTDQGSFLDKIKKSLFKVFFFSC